MMNKLISKQFTTLVSRDVAIEQNLAHSCSVFGTNVEITKHLEELGYGA